MVPCIRSALLRGYIAPPVLAPRIVEAREQWLDWHHNFAANQLPGMIAKDEELARQVEAMDNKAEVVVINPSDTALQVGVLPCSALAIQFAGSRCSLGRSTKSLAWL